MFTKCCPIFQVLPAVVYVMPLGNKDMQCLCKKWHLILTTWSKAGLQSTLILLIVKAPCVKIFIRSGFYIWYNLMGLETWGMQVPKKCIPSLNKPISSVCMAYLLQLSSCNIYYFIFSTFFVDTTKGTKQILWNVKLGEENVQKTSVCHVRWRSASRQECLWKVSYMSDNMSRQSFIETVHDISHGLYTFNNVTGCGHVKYRSSCSAFSIPEESSCQIDFYKTL